jgi:hypothetical protein
MEAFSRNFRLSFVAIVHELFCDDEPSCLSDKGEPAALVSTFSLAASSFLLGAFAD